MCGTVTVPRHYQGTELELFQHAVNWKGYYAKRFRPFIQGDVLEVGAGIGGTTPFLCRGGETRWTCLEPDPLLADVLRRAYPAGHINGVPLRVESGTVAELPLGARFDTIIYIDVLEHIDADVQELARAVAHLSQGGHLIVLSPAHQFLYSEFDRAVGHFRRYSVSQLRALAPPGTRLIRAQYLDSVGALLSLLNRFLLKQRQPRAVQIAFWDRYVLSLSRITDYALNRVLGRSVIAVWRRV
jgi:SAM-dependent methyltransferase